MSVYDTMVTGLAGAGLILLGFVTTQGASDFHLNAAQIEAELTQNANSALAQAGQNWAEVSFDGQSAIISGAAPDQTSIDQATVIVLESAGHGGILWGGVVSARSTADIRAFTPAEEPYRPEPISPDNTDAESEETDQETLVENREESE